MKIINTHLSHFPKFTILALLLLITQSLQFPEQHQQFSQSKPINFTFLNHKLETLNNGYLRQFQRTFTAERIQKFNDDEAGSYLFLLGKMYLYNILPQKIQYQNNIENKPLIYNSNSRYLLAYFYLQMAAEVYENGDAYYYLAVLEYVKMTPTTLIKSNIKSIVNRMKKQQKGNGEQSHNHLLKIIKEWQQKQIMQHDELVQYLEDITFDMESHHLHNTQHNLYLASVLGQIPAKLTLAYLLKQGISTDKNCSAAISYYLSVIKQTKIDTFQYPSDYIDRKSFQKQLYSRQKLDLSKYGDYDPTVLMHTSMFNEDSLSAFQDVAMKYMTGEDGYPVNEELSVQMFERIEHKSRLARLMLGFMYLKGRGVSKNYARARQLFETDERSSKVAKQTLIVMKFYSLGFESKSKEALDEMKDLYFNYERRMNITAIRDEMKLKQQQAKNNKQKGNKNGEPEKEEKDKQVEQEQKQEGDGQSPKQILKNLKQRKQALRTPMIKFLIGSLVLSENIKGEKNHAINLIDEAAKQGNTLALTLLGLVFIDGSDASYDCQRSSNYFSKEALSHAAIQQRIQLAKMGIKKGNYMFSFVKYVQLMMVGYKNAFINALYLTEVYRHELFQFNDQSWSIQQAQKNDVYKFLIKEEIVEKISQHIVSSLGLHTHGLFNEKTVEYLTKVQEKSVANGDQNGKISSSISQYVNYINIKITSIGIMKHDISILRFFKYKQTKDIETLHQLANLGQSNPHIYESRFLLGRYYHHTNISGSNQGARHRRAIEEYNRATKNNLLGGIIYLIEGGQFKQSQKILSHFYGYLTVIVVVGMVLYRKKNKKMEEIFEMERKKQEEQAKLLEQSQSNHMKEERGSGYEDTGMREQSELKKNQFLFEEYRGPKFSEQQAEHMIRSRNLMSIGLMMDERMRNLSEEKHRHLVKEQGVVSEQGVELGVQERGVIQQDGENSKYHDN